MQVISTKILKGDASKVLKELDDNSVDLIVTSPPYADRRKNTYGGIKPDEYVNWFLPISEELLRVLKPSGTFILNIKEKAENGERHTYVLELILALRKQGWLWTEEFIWQKKNSYPGKWPNRFRDSWERCLQFNKTKKFNMYQEEVMVPVGDWAENRLKKLSEVDKERDNSKNGSGFGKNISNWIGREMVYPNNVLHFSTYLLIFKIKSFPIFHLWLIQHKFFVFYVLFYHIYIFINNFNAYRISIHSFSYLQGSSRTSKRVENCIKFFSK